MSEIKELAKEWQIMQQFKLRSESLKKQLRNGYDYDEIS